MNRPQLPRPLWKKAYSVFKRLSACYGAHVPSINQDLRIAGLNSHQIETFWESTRELSSWRKMDEDRAKRDAEMLDGGMTTDELDAWFHDNP